MNWASLTEQPPRLTELTLGRHFVVYAHKLGTCTFTVKDDIAKFVARLVESGWTHWDWIVLPPPPADPLDVAIQEMLKSNVERAVVARNFYAMGIAAGQFRLLNPQPEKDKGYQ